MVATPDANSHAHTWEHIITVKHPNNLWLLYNSWFVAIVTRDDRGMVAAPTTVGWENRAEDCVIVFQSSKSTLCNDENLTFLLCEQDILHDKLS